jgi:tetratricopeptide (TPR) repeat protein
MAWRDLTNFYDVLARGAAWSRERLARIPHRLAQRTGERPLLRLLAQIPDRGKLANVKAKILWALNDRAQALHTARRALVRNPRQPALIASLAQMEIDTGCYADAEARLRSVLADQIASGQAAMLRKLVTSLTYALLHQGKSQDAWELLSSGAGVRLALDRTRFLQAHVCRYTRRYDEAERLYREVLAQKPNDVPALSELAELLSFRGRFDEAMALHHRLEQATGDPARNARNHSHTLLAQGRVREGWARNMLRLENTELKKLPGIRVWDGSDLTTRSILVIVEGGPGDELRDAACYQELSQRAAQVTVACDPRIETLLRRSMPNVRTLPVRRAERISGVHRRLSRLMDNTILEEARRHDVCVISPDLFHFLKPRAEDYGTPAPYLLPDPALVADWRERLAALGPGPKIGIAWSTVQQTYRTCPYYTKLAEWGPILKTPGAVFVNLQYGDCTDELSKAEHGFGIQIHRWPDLDLLNDFESVAGLMAALDLVLAPNSTTLELAGALGVRAWYMVNEYQTLDHFRLKDRMTRQDRSYPSVTIFMAQQPGDSASLIAQVAAELRRTFGVSGACFSEAGTGSPRASLV